MRKASNPFHIGIVKVSVDLLSEMFHIPDGHRIIAVFQDYDEADTFSILCEGPMIPESGRNDPAVHVGFEVSVTETGEMIPQKKFVGKFVAREVAAPTQSTEDAA